MHAKANVIVFPDGTWAVLAGSRWFAVRDLDVLTHGDSVDVLVEHGEADVLVEWPASDIDDERP